MCRKLNLGPPLYANLLAAKSNRIYIEFKRHLTICLSIYLSINRSTAQTVDGILSSEPKDNPYLWNANHIYVPYCSSDSWTGFQEARADRSSFAFMGSKIVEKVVHSLFEDLPRESSLYESKFVLLAGDSAGATGVILNLDKVNRLVQQKFSNASSPGNQSNCSQENLSNCEPPRQVPILRGLADSGWFLDNEPYDYNSGATPLSQQDSNYFGASSSSGTGTGSTNGEQLVDCDRQRCTPLQSIRMAMLHWNGQVPVACANRQPYDPWRCYFAYRAYQTLKTPLFVVQWLYDEAQLMVDNIIRPGTIGQWNYVSKLANEMRASLENVTALFAPSCFSHSLIVKQSWNQININGFKLPHVLKSWEEEILTNQPTLETLNLDQEVTVARQLATSDLVSATTIGRELLNDKVYQPPATSNFELRSYGSRQIINNGNQAATQTNPRPKGRKKKRNNNSTGHNNNNQHTSSINNNRIGPSTNRLSRSASVDDATLIFNNSVPDILIISASKQQESTEKFRLIDTCGWPQCNRDCPYLDHDINPKSTLPYR